MLPETIIGIKNPGDKCPHTDKIIKGIKEKGFHQTIHQPDNPNTFSTHTPLPEAISDLTEIITPICRECKHYVGQQIFPETPPCIGMSFVGSGNIPNEQAGLVLTPEIKEDRSHKPSNN